jgi:hypothetical protein
MYCSSIFSFLTVMHSKADDLKRTVKDCFKLGRERTHLGRNCPLLKGENPPWKDENPF